MFANEEQHEKGTHTISAARSFYSHLRLAGSLTMVMTSTSSSSSLSDDASEQLRSLRFCSSFLVTSDFAVREGIDLIGLLVLRLRTQVSLSVGDNSRWVSLLLLLLSCSEFLRSVINGNGGIWGQEDLRDLLLASSNFFGSEGLDVSECSLSVDASFALSISTVVIVGTVADLDGIGIAIRDSKGADILRAPSLYRLASK